MRRFWFISLRLLVLMWAGSRGDTCLSQPLFSLEMRAGKFCVALPVDQVARQVLTPEKALQIFVVLEDTGKSVALPPVLGSYQQEQDHLVFCPLFPFPPNRKYRVVSLGELLGEFEVPQPAGRKPPGLQAVFPSADTLPANLLRLYLHFATPMSEGHVYDHIQLLDETGTPLAAPFVHLEPALWDKENRRLTLWLDPGRVKRALGPNESLGPVLLPGQVYTLVLDSLWRDAQGQALGSGCTRRFWVGTDDRQRPDVSQWQVEAPARASRDTLRIAWGEPLDHALALQCLSVWDKRGAPVAGTVSLHKGERTWTFVPESPWQPGRYRLRVDTRLEDVAGNNMNRLFDRDLQMEHEAPAEAKEQHFLFKIR